VYPYETTDQLALTSETNNTFLYEMTSWPPFWNYWNYDVKSENTPDKFYPDPIWNNEAAGFFEEVAKQEKKKNNKMSIDIRSINQINQL